MNGDVHGDLHGGIAVDGPPGAGVTSPLSPVPEDSAGSAAGREAVARELMVELAQVVHQMRALPASGPTSAGWSVLGERERAIVAELHARQVPVSSQADRTAAAQRALPARPTLTLVSSSRASPSSSSSMVSSSSSLSMLGSSSVLGSSSMGGLVGGAALFAEIAELEKAVLTRTVIGQAEGILMERHQVSAEDAFEMLRRASQHSNRKLRDLAADLVHTGLEPPAPPRPRQPQAPTRSWVVASQAPAVNLGR